LDRVLKSLPVPDAGHIQVAGAVKIPVFAQHVDSAGAGVIQSYHCRVHPFIGASEHLSTIRTENLLSEIDATIQSAKKAGLVTIVCTNNIAVTSAASALSPDFVAVEPPELIGSGIPVSKANRKSLALGERRKKIIPKSSALRRRISTGMMLRRQLSSDEGVLLASGYKGERP